VRRESLPVFGEGGRAKRGRVGFTGTAVPWTDPTPTLPEDGEGEVPEVPLSHLSAQWAADNPTGCNSFKSEVIAL
jgi:hypothetical protein